MLRRSILAASFLTALLTACGGGGGGGGNNDYERSALAITASGNVIIFTIANPSTIDSTRALTGLPAGETVVGVDGRPANGGIYVLTRQAGTGRIYRLSSSTGVLTLESTLSADPGDTTSAYTGLTGTQFGIDFDPTIDRLRVVSDTGQNLRVNVSTGAVITDDPITGAVAQISGVAYTNPFAGASSTTLYDIDAGAGMLYVQSTPNSGTLTSPVTLGVSGNSVNGFDIDGFDRGYAALTVGGVTGLYRINLSASSNAATLIGTIGTGTDPVLGFLRLD